MSREVVLGKLNMLVKKFVKKVCIKQGLGEKVVSEAGGKIFTFGSYRLGVHSSGMTSLILLAFYTCTVSL